MGLKGNREKVALALAKKLLLLKVFEPARTFNVLCTRLDLQGLSISGELVVYTILTWWRSP